MNYSKKDVVVGFVIIILIIAGVFYYKKVRTPKPATTPTPVSINFKKEMEDSFKYSISDNANSIELKDVSGGNGRGIATKKEILVDIDDPQTGYFYQAWLENGAEPVSIGKLVATKGGWLIEYNKPEYSGYKKIVISLEKVFDNKMEKKILEGSFN